MQSAERRVQSDNGNDNDNGVGWVTRECFWEEEDAHSLAPGGSDR